jgi:hypothetical protein
VIEAALVAVLAMGGCTLFHGSFPDETKCKSDNECWRAQGEKCMVQTGECVVPVPSDAAPPLPDGTPIPDAGPDADVPDGPLADGAGPDV